MVEKISRCISIKVQNARGSYDESLCALSSRDFSYWLQGFLEINRAAEPLRARTFNESQIACIEKHLAMVFTHEIDPSFGDTNAALDAIHHPPKIGGTTSEGVLVRC
jgi:hypothetical protein